MHPILSDRAAFVLYLLVFLVIGIVMALLLNIAGGIQWGGALAFSIPMALLFGIICLSSWYVCRAFPLKTTRITQIAGVFSIASIVSSALWIGVGEILASSLSGFEFASSLAGRSLNQTLLLGSTGVGLYLLSVAVHYLLMTYQQAQEGERRALELRLLAQTAEVKALRAQINPHFLFNSLNSISALTTKDPTNARSMTLLLADFLRQTLKISEEDLIPLNEEISICRKFINIEQVRFGARLGFSEQIAGETGQYRIPPLLLQPLVENAVVHGIAHCVDGGTITLDAGVHGDRLTVRIQNPCDPERPKPRTIGMGLDNVRKRLQAFSESDCRLDVSEHNGTFTAELSLPARQA